MGDKPSAGKLPSSKVFMIIFLRENPLFTKSAAYVASF